MKLINARTHARTHTHTLHKHTHTCARACTYACTHIGAHGTFKTQPCPYTLSLLLFSPALYSPSLISLTPSPKTAVCFHHLCIPSVWYPPPPQPAVYLFSPPLHSPSLISFPPPPHPTPNPAVLPSLYRHDIVTHRAISGTVLWWIKHGNKIVSFMTMQFSFFLSFFVVVLEQKNATLCCKVD